MDHYEMTKEDIISYIKSGETDTNYLFSGVSKEMMQEFVEYLSNSDTANYKYIHIDFDEKEVQHVESMITSSVLAFENESNEEISTNNGELNKKLTKLEKLIKKNPELSEDLMKLKTELTDQIENNRVCLNQTTSSNNSIKNNIRTRIAEEYIWGKIISIMSKTPELSGKYQRKNLEIRLEYFKKFMSSDKKTISPDEFIDFKGNGFWQPHELHELIKDKDLGVTICFTNFQNISNPFINRIINGMTSVDSKAIRTMIFTTGDGLLTSLLRGEGTIDSRYDYKERVIRDKQLRKQ